MRRVLIIPSVSTVSVAENASYQELYQLTEEVAKAGSDVFWYMVVPPWVRDGLQGHKRLHYVHVETTRDLELNDIIGYSAYDLAVWFARRGGKFIIDAVVTDCVQFSLQLSQFLSDPSSVPVPVFLRDLRRRDRRRNPDLGSRLSIAMNYATARVGATSSWHKAELTEYVRSCLVPAQVKRFISRTFDWPLSIDLDFLENCRDTVEKGKTPVVFVGGNPDDNGGKKVLRICRKLFALGVEVALTSRSSPSRVKLLLPDRDISYISEIKSSVPRDSYYLEAAKAHMFISVGRTEGAFHEELERLILGQVGVFPYKEFVIELFGDKYPFYYNEGDMDEAYEMTAWVAENYDEAIGMIEPFVKIVKEKLSRSQVFLDAWATMGNSIDEGYRVHTMRDAEDGKALPLLNAVKKVAEGLGEEFAMTVFLDVLEETVSYLKPWGRKGTLQTLGRVKTPLPTLYDLREMLDNLGWVDQHSGSEIIVRKVRDPLKGVLNG